jgi:hypothetical protein
LHRDINIIMKPSKILVCNNSIVLYYYINGIVVNPPRIEDMSRYYLL